MQDDTGGDQPCCVLLVDDSSTVRLMIGARLRALGFAVVEAADGEEALARLDAGGIDIVLSDWVMPGMDGIGLCRAVRARTSAEETYVYIVLMTSRQDPDAVAEGLDAGADDFVTKPVDTTELAARLRAGQRLVDANRRLDAARRRTVTACSRVSRLYERLQQDLAAAAALQRQYFPPARMEVNGWRVGALCRQKDHVGGDHVGVVRLSDSALGIYSIDVAGHGVASCLLALRLAQYFTPREHDAGIAARPGPSGRSMPRHPDEVLAELNGICMTTVEHDVYFTMAYAVIDTEHGGVELGQAGHWPAAILAPDGDVAFVESGLAPPIGLIDDAQFPVQRFRLAPGERLMLYTDGLTEVEGAEGMLGQSGLARLVGAVAHEKTGDLLPALCARIEAEAGRDCFEDDVSAVVIERPAAVDLAIAS